MLSTMMRAKGPCSRKIAPSSRKVCIWEGRGKDCQTGGGCRTRKVGI